MPDNDFYYIFLSYSLSAWTWPNINNKWFFLFMKHKNRYVMFVLHLSLRCLLYYWVFHVAFQLCMTHQVERGIEHHDATLLSIMEFYKNCMGLKTTEHMIVVFTIILLIQQHAHISMPSTKRYPFLRIEHACIQLKNLVSWNWCVLTNMLL